jgi:hypothetical protein
MTLAGCGACSGQAASSGAPAALSEHPVPELTVGYYSKIDFTPLDANSDCPVLWGLQGGNWTMPTLRARHFGPRIVASGKLTLRDEELGRASADADLVDRGDGWWELTYLPIPVTHAPPNETAPIDDIYQQRAVLSISVVDQDQKTFDVEHGVVLIQSEVTE